MANELDYAVSVGNVGEDDHSTVMIGGVDVVVPLEMDLDGDPLHDDEVRLSSPDGGFERVLLVSDPDVECDLDARLAHYRFRAVPYGRYDVATRVAGRWLDVITGLTVTKNGVFASTGEVDDTPADAPAEAPEPAEEEIVPDEDPRDPEDPLYLDQVPSLDDEELV